MAELALIFCAVAWSSAYFFMKVSLNDLDPLTILTYRYFIGAACLLPFVLNHRIFNWLLIKWGFLTGSVLFLLLYPMVLALVDGSVTNAGFIVGLFVVLVPIFSYLLYRTHFSRFDVGAVVFSVTGLWILTGGVQGTSGSDLLFLISAFCCAVHVLLIERATQTGLNLVALGFIQCVVVGILGTAACVATDVPWPILSGVALNNMLILGIIPSGLCLLLQLYGQRKVPAWRASLIYASEPVITVIIAYYALQEPLTQRVVFGGLFIIAAIFLPGLSSRKQISGSPEYR